VPGELQPETNAWALNRALEDRVAEQEGELAAIYDQIPYGLAVVDSTTQLVRRANRRALEILGPVLGARLTGVQRFYLDGRPMPSELAPDSRALGGERVVPERLRVVTPDGRERIVEMGAVPLVGVDGTVTAAAVTVDDVTHRHTREESDRQFIVNSAHQLRTPITAIASALAALEAGAKNSAPELEHFLGHIERGTERMVRLVESLLTLARLDRGGDAPALTVVPVRPMLQQAASEADPPKGVRMRVDAPADIGAVTNRGLLLEVVVNLVTNAIAHTPSGQIVLRAQRDEAEMKTWIEVSDSGPGVPVEKRPLIFDRFYRASDGTKGAGLGLAIARDVMRVLHGSVEIVDTPPGEGATFRLTLPGARILS
jgi:two-component system phosphate regulon sensor histidine kinase PhoR